MLTYYGAQLHTLTGHVGAVHCLAFTPDAKRLVSGAEDGHVKARSLARPRGVSN